MYDCIGKRQYRYDQYNNHTCIRNITCLNIAQNNVTLQNYKLSCTYNHVCTTDSKYVQICNTADRPPTVSAHFGLSFGAKILTPAVVSYELIMVLKMYYSKNYPSTSVYRKAITRAQNKLQVQSVEILQGCAHSMCNVLLVHVWESGRKHTAVMGRV